MHVAMPGDVQQQLLRPPEPGSFSEAEIDGLPEPVRRHLLAAIEPGTPLAVSARLRMRGHIKLNRWLPFQAAQILSPHHGFLWSGRTLGVISGYDRYVAGRGEANWKVLGLIPVMRAVGPDVSRSAAGRGAAESIWVPTALLPRFGVDWSATDDRHITARYRLDATDLELHLALDGHGRVVSVTFDRWGDPDDTGTWGWYPFGVKVTGYSTFDGASIPSAGRAGWFFGTERWGDGEFFRYEIIDLRFVR